MTAAKQATQKQPGAKSRQAKPRGPAAEPQTVDLYRLLYEAGRPLTVTEIVERMPAAYKTHANIEFRAHVEALGEAEGFAVKGVDRDKAWRWWIGKLIQAGVDARWIAIDTQDGPVARGKTRGKNKDQLLYSANMDRPPAVQVRTEIDDLAYWTPEIGQTGTRHAAGMAFLQQVDAILAQPQLAADVKDALELAVRAIRVGSLDSPHLRGESRPR